MGAFVISPLPPVLLEPVQVAGPLRSQTLLCFSATTDPSVTLSPVADFPVSPVIRFPAPPISRRGEEGFSSCSAHPCHRAVAVTPPECLVPSVSLQTIHAAFAS